MAHRARSRMWASGACYLALAAFATLASGIPVVARGPFALPPNTNLDVYTAPSAPEPLAAATVATQAGGTVLVRGYHAAGYVPIGSVPPLKTCVFEAPFARLNLASPGAPSPIATAGTYEVRAPTDGPDADRLLGAGTVDLLPGPSFGVYGSFSGTCALVARPRLLAVNLTANASNASVTTTGGTPSPTPYVIEGGDWGFCSRTITTFRVAGSGLVPFEVYDPTPNCLPIQGIARAQAMDTGDSIDVDGTRDLEVTLVYHGAGALQISYMLSGNPTAVTLSLTDGQSTGPVQGLLTLFEWTYAQAGDWVSISIRGH